MNLIFLRDSRAKEMFKSVKIPTLELMEGDIPNAH